MSIMKKILAGTLFLSFFAASACAEPKSATLVLLRSGELEDPALECFAGWSDVRMSREGVKQCFDVGLTMREQNMEFDVIHVSLLDRSIATGWLVASAMNRAWVPVERYWRLNERSCGDLEGKTLAEVTAAVGAEQAELWNTSLTTPPPAMAADDERSPLSDRRYAAIDSRALPLAESLKDTINRIAPYWTDTLLPQLGEGKKILVVGHKDSLRALSTWIDASIDDEALAQLQFSYAKPVIYKLEVEDGSVTIVSREEMTVVDHPIPMPPAPEKKEEPAAK